MRVAPNHALRCAAWVARPGGDWRRRVLALNHRSTELRRAFHWFWDAGTNLKTEENGHDAVYRNFAFGKRPIG